MGCGIHRRGYFAALLRDYFNEVRVDFLRLSDMLCSGYERFRTYYYDCMPYQSNSPTDEERKRYADNSRFIEYFKKLPRFEVRLGKFRKGRYGFEQADERREITQQLINTIIM